PTSPATPGANQRNRWPHPSGCESLPSASRLYEPSTPEGDTPMTTTFDPAAYKDTTRLQWDEAAAAWHAWAPTLEEWLSEATTLMLDAAGIHAGSKVLDVAAGAGGQSLAAARRVGPSGRVLATDISAVILQYAASAAAAAGIATMQVRQLDAEQLDVEPAVFDA